MTDTPERMVPIEEAIREARKSRDYWRGVDTARAMDQLLKAVQRLDALRAARARGETLVPDGE